jgi:DNA-binding helix-hairpin-helix protein with protein kinase domain
MSKTFVTPFGKTIQIGRKLGEGGEGSVYELLGNDHWVAKLYNTHHQPDAQKQAKLRFMAATADKELLNYAAWPQATLHNIPNGPVVGFLMTKVSGRAPIHMLYSPAHRRQDYPRKGWDFLLFAARNTAAAFNAIHNHGHVLGDVNQGNVLVGHDSKVVLIDTDSFQIRANGMTHLCKVGVAHFTPPELQQVASFDQVSRTSNHDNFGLALLIFHLLFGGRHPYSGVPLQADAGEVLERDIKAFRYAYAPDGQQRGFNPPPKSIPISLVPDPIQAMFTFAFTENGAKVTRPTAQQWVTTLDNLREHVKRCATTPIHVYPDHLGRCPWCVMENSGVIYFLDLQAGIGSTGTTGFVFARTWAAIEAVQPPPTIPIPQIASIAVKPAPLPPGIQQQGMIAFWRFVVVGVTLFLLTIIPGAWFFLLGGACVMWAFGEGLGADERKAERTKRQATQEKTQLAFDQLVAQFRYEATSETFARKKQELSRLRDEYLHLPKREEMEIASLHSTAESRQKQQFLERYFLDSAVISGVGPTKKAALRSFGIETAADVTWSKVISVKGFGEVLTRAVVDWRKACERRFVFNPNLAVTDSDKTAVRAKILSEQRNIEVKLENGPAELQRLRQDTIRKANTLQPRLQAAGLKLAQASADLTVF